MRNWSGLMACEGGATAVEYALIAALISVAILGAIVGLGTSLSDQFALIAATTSGGPQAGP